jgi:adenine-specific DNA-methyltransferase
MKPISTFINTVINADCLTVLPEIPSHNIDLVITDPPYLVNYQPRDGRTCLNDTNAHWLRPAFNEMYRVLKADSFLVTFYGWPWIDLFMKVWKEIGFRPVSHLVWSKSHSSRDGYTKSYHEVGFLLAKGRPPKPQNPIPDVLPWEYTGNKYHTNEKPVIALKPIIETCSKLGDIVLDPFAGSGTTGVAAKECDRNFILIEKVLQHWQVAKRRVDLRQGINSENLAAGNPVAEPENHDEQRRFS